MANTTKSTFPTFLLVAFLTAALLVGGVVVVNYYIDPYGVRPSSDIFRANLKSRPAMNYDEFLHKAYALSNAKAKSVYFGSSKTCLGLPPNHPGVEAPAYNCGLLGSTSQETLAYLRHAIALGDIKTAYIGIEAEFLIKDAKKPGKDTAPPLSHEYLLQSKGEIMRPAVFSPAIFSLGAFKESCKIVRGSPYPQTTYPGGLCDDSIGRGTINNDSVQSAERLLGEDSVRETIAKLGRDSSILDESLLSNIRQIAAACHQAGIKLVIFTQPLNPLFYEKIEAAGGLKSLETAKGAIADLLAEELPADQIHFYDFATKNSVAADLRFESPDSKVWLNWWECSHYRPSFGAKMLDVMTGRSAGTKDGFGSPIAPKAHRTSLPARPGDKAEALSGHAHTL